MPDGAASCPAAIFRTCCADPVRIQGRIIVSLLRPPARRRSVDVSPRLTGTGGATLAVSANELLDGSAGAIQFAHQVFAILGERIPVSVTIDGLGHGRAAVDGLARVCELIHPALARAQAASRNIQITIPADAMLPLQAWSIRRRRLGPGRINLLTGDTAPRLRRSDRADSFWRQLWRLRGHSELLCTFAATVSPTCPLLALERASAVEPRLALLAPVGSAWAWAIVHVDDFVDVRGSLDQQALESELEFCVELGERLHDTAVWPTPTMRQDSWRNRRIAILLGGLGNIVTRRKLDPREFRCHEELRQLLVWIRSVVTAHSRRLAVRNDLLPALIDNDPMLRLAPSARAGWKERWNTALQTAAVRHRNLLAMSPWSVLPTSPKSPAAFFDLLSLLDAADACTFQPPCPIRHYNLKEFIELYALSRAALARCDARRPIAEQV